MARDILKDLYECIDNYWKYYQKLENDLIATEQYLSIDNDNKKGFSIAYLQLYLSIGSEVDVIAKRLSKECNESFSGDKIQEYCKEITSSLPNFKKEEIYLLFRNYDSIIPWNTWEYSEITDINGKRSIRSKDSPSWWKNYNKIKHDRMGAISKDKPDKKYYQLANQENILGALSGLYLLEMYLYTEVLKKYKSIYSMPINKFDYLWINKSKLFGLKSLKTNRYLGESTFNNCSFFFCENSH